MYADGGEGSLDLHALSELFLSFDECLIVIARIANI